MKWISGVTLALVAMLGMGWIFRAQLALLGGAQIMHHIERGPYL